MSRGTRKMGLRMSLTEIQRNNYLRDYEY